MFSKGVVAVAGSSAGLLLAGCSPAPAHDAGLEVMAAFYPLEYVAEEVAGDRATVTSLTPAGADSHDLELSPNVVARMNAADVVVYLSGFQPAVDDAVEQAAPRYVLDVAGAARLLATDEHGGSEDEAADRTEGADEPPGHDHGATDPHFWLDPLRLASVSTAVADVLAQADPVNAEVYRADGHRLATDLRALDGEIRAGLDRCEGETIVVTHDAYGYLADAYGLDVVSIAGLDPESEPSPARMVAVADAARRTGAGTVFLASPEDRVAEALAGDLGLGTAVLDPLETQQDPDADYPAVVRANLVALQEALRCR